MTRSTDPLYSILRDRMEELTDRDFQERCWVRAETEAVSSFTEVVCGIYDDAGGRRYAEPGSPLDRAARHGLREFSP